TPPRAAPADPAARRRRGPPSAPAAPRHPRARWATRLAPARTPPRTRRHAAALTARTAVLTRGTSSGQAGCGRLRPSAAWHYPNATWHDLAPRCTTPRRVARHRAALPTLQ